MVNLEHAKNNKDIRYDRQLRLWGDSGQHDLEISALCLLNASVTGAEILKSLVLPGVGSFTVIDHRVVTDSDLNSNFFLDASQIGSSLAESVCNHIIELNPDVHGKFLLKNVDDWTENDGDKSVLDQFDLVIGTDLCEKSYLEIGQYLYEKKKPFIICKTYGLLGYLRIVAPEHHVFDGHPDFKPNSFQLDRPFPHLKRFADSINLQNLNHEKHSHIPYLILILKGLEKWRQAEENGGKKFPSNYAEKTKLKEILLSMRMPDEKGNLDEENIHEALNTVASSVRPSSLPNSLQKLFADPRVENNVGRKHFWLLCRALRTFIFQGNIGALPLRGDLPDMISDSDNYVRLQNLYYDRAEEQARCVYDHVCNLAVHGKLVDNEVAVENCKLRCENGKNRVVDLPSFEQTRIFCKNAAFIDVIDSRPLLYEYDPTLDCPCDQNTVVGLQKICEQTIQSDEHGIEKRALDFYIIWRACERFRAEKNRYPGTNGVPENLDKLDLISRMKNLSNVYKLPISYVVDDSLVEEMCRFGASEIHSVASIMGGLAAQEAIKLITGQYIPLNNTFIFDGNTGAGVRFEF